MKVRLPKSNGMGNIKDMAAKVQGMQAEMEKATEDLENKEYDFTSGGGAVKVKIKGSLEITSLEIEPDIIDKDDRDMLQEIVIAAVNGAIKIAQDDKDKVMQGISEKMNLPMNIPGLF